MSIIDNLRRLANSGKPENIEMAKKLIAGQNLYKARGIFKICEREVTNGVIFPVKWPMCGCQARAKCKYCRRLFCLNHYVQVRGLCSGCQFVSEDSLIHMQSLDENDFDKMWGEDTHRLKLGILARRKKDGINQDYDDR